MINRVLIRIKVVQILYSYLVSDNTFSIEDPAESQTREKRFAYQTYLEMLALMVEISDNIKQRGGYTPLAHTRFIEVIETQDRISAITHGRVPSRLPLERISDVIAAKIKDSAIYRNYIKDGEKDHRIWSALFKHYISSESSLIFEYQRMENFTLHAFERACQMVETTFSKFYASSDDIAGVVRNLERALDKARELYLRLLTLPVAITRQRESDLEENRKKYILTAEDENPNMRFVDNKLVALLSHDEKLQAVRDSDNSLNWLPDDRQLIKSLLKAIMQSEPYEKYMSKEGKSDMKEDADFWREIYKKVIFQNEEFLGYLEEKSVFWNDDIDIIGEFLLKTLKKYAVEGYQANGMVKSCMMPKYKDEEDSSFGRELITYALKNRVSYLKMIASTIDEKKWDSERIPLMDMAILITALAEILNFQSIPLQVSINEYINIAKAFSTPKSGIFVNGVLATIVNGLKEEGKLRK